MSLFSRLALSIILTITILTPAASSAAIKTAIFAMGCFWCAEHDMEKLPGVNSVISGYTGGKLKNPGYEQVSAGGTGHFEAIKVIYNDQQVSYEKLLSAFWHNVDPLDAYGQFCDKGDQYRSAIFYENATQKNEAIISRQKIEKQIGKVETLILPAGVFYPAETYHQNYANKNPVRYNYYRYRCGRDARLKAVWGKK